MRKENYKLFFYGCGEGQKKVKYFSEIKEVKIVDN